MLAKRIIPCLDVAAGQVVKGVRFQKLKVCGDIVELATFYAENGADELVFYDIKASPEGRHVDLDWMTRVAEQINIPFTVAGGIRSCFDAERCLHAGADKISINTPALERPELINELVQSFGQQCIVVGVDSCYIDGRYCVYKNSGCNQARGQSGYDTMLWLEEVESRGAGEVVLNCMDQDGVRQGYDIDQLSAARSALSIPLIASGGAGKAEDFLDVFNKASVDGALAASVFHRQEVNLMSLKRYLAQHSIQVRL